MYVSRNVAKIGFCQFQLKEMKNAEYISYDCSFTLLNLIIAVDLAGCGVVTSAAHVMNHMRLDVIYHK